MATNALKNTSLVTKFAVKEFLNALIMGQKVDRQVSEKFTSKVGATILVRRPVMFEATSGATLSTSNIEEATIPVVVDQRWHVSFEITDTEETLNIEDANERYIKPAMEELAQLVETSLGEQYYQIPNFIGTPGTTPSTFRNVADAGAVLSRLGVPMTDRSAFYDSDASVAIADGLKGVFPESIARTAIEEASIGRYAKFDIFESNSLDTHTVGVVSGTPLVNGASQNVTYATAKDTDSQTLITNGWTSDTSDIVLAGDVITIAGVNEVNRRTRKDTGHLQTFTILADADAGASTGPATLTIAPPIITSGPYQTVTAAPANDAVITVKTGTGGVSYRQNIAFHKNALTLAFAKLVAFNGDGASGAQQSFKGVSITSHRQYNITDSKLVYRFDVLFGIKAQNRSFAVRTTG